MLKSRIPSDQAVLPVRLYIPLISSSGGAYTPVPADSEYHRIRIKTEEKAEGVDAAWGAELIQFFAALAILHQDDLKNRMNCTRR